MKLFRRPLPAALAACLFTGSCSSLQGPMEDDSDDAQEMQPHPRRAEMPSLFGPGSTRLKSGKFPVIHFGHDSWNLPAPERAKVRAVATYLTGHPERIVLAAGATGISAEYARQLSDLRAQTVRKALIDAGVPASKILSVAFGEDATGVTGGGVSFSLIGTGEG